jgi:hypothetical protein
MKDDPEELLGICPASSAPGDVETRTGFWIASLVCPPLFYGLGLLMVYSIPTNGGGGWGKGALIPIAGGVMALGCILSIVFSAISIVKRERHSLLSLFASFPCAVATVWTIGLAGC